MKALKNAKKGFHIILVHLHIYENNIFNILFKDTPKAFDDLKKKKYKVMTCDRYTYLYPDYSIRYTLR